MFVPRPDHLYDLANCSICREYGAGPLYRYQDLSGQNDRSCNAAKSAEIGDGVLISCRDLATGQQDHKDRRSESALERCGGTMVAITLESDSGHGPLVFH